jgi:hypothetical protein
LLKSKSGWFYIRIQKINHYFQKIKNFPAGFPENGIPVAVNPVQTDENTEYYRISIKPEAFIQRRYA